MTIASANNRMDYTGTGLVSSYAYTFKIFSSSDLLVTVRDTYGVESTLELASDYTVTGAGSGSGGNVVLSAALGDGSHLTIRRVRSVTQTTDIRNQGAFYPEAHEDVFDHLTMIAQQHQDELDRSLKVSETVSGSTFNTTLPSELITIANTVIMTNSDGTGFAAGPTAENIAAVDDLIENVTAYADAALASKNAALAAQVAAEAAAATASASGVSDTAYGVSWNAVTTNAPSKHATYAYLSVLKDATETLTNKTISGSANTITNIGASALSSDAVTTAKILDGSVTKAKQAARGQVISSTLSSQTVTSTSFTVLTNLSVSATSEVGGPVLLMLNTPASTTLVGSIAHLTSGASVQGEIQFRRGSTVICTMRIGRATVDNITYYYPPTMFQFLDVPPAGTYTYTARARLDSSAGTASLTFSYVTLVAIPL